MAEFLINLPELEGKARDADVELTGRREYSWPIRAAWLREQLDQTDLSAPDDAKDGSLNVRAHKVGEDVLVEGDVDTVLSVPCSRCNELTPIPVKAMLTQLFTHRGSMSALPEELELTPEDLERETFSGDSLALDAVVREFIILELPMSPKCADGCKDPVVKAILEGSSKPTEKKGALAALLDLKIDKEPS